MDRRLADLGAGRRQLRGRGPARQGPRPEPPLVPADPPPLPLQARRPARRAVVPPRAGDLAARARPQPLPAHRARRCASPASSAPRSRPSPPSERAAQERQRCGGGCRRRAIRSGSALGDSTNWGAKGVVSAALRTPVRRGGCGRAALARGGQARAARTPAKRSRWRRLLGRPGSSSWRRSTGATTRWRTASWTSSLRERSARCVMSTWRSASHCWPEVTSADARPGGTPFPTDVDDAIVNMRVIDAVYRAAGLEPRSRLALGEGERLVVRVLHPGDLLEAAWGGRRRSAGSAAACRGCCRRRTGRSCRTGCVARGLVDHAGPALLGLRADLDDVGAARRGRGPGASVTKSTWSPL